MNNTLKFLNQFLASIGISESALSASSTTIMAFILIGLCFALYHILTRLVTPLILKIAFKTSIKWDDIIFRKKFLNCLWLLVSVIVGNVLVPTVFVAYPKMEQNVLVVTNILMIMAFTACIIELLKSVFLLFADKNRVDEIATSLQESEITGKEYRYEPSHSLKGLQQMITVIIVGIAVILSISVLFGKDPLIILSGLSAGAAVLMLVFKDSILGVVAGVQLTANKMVQPGDWITAPKYGVNGIVREITLATVKVENFDNTIVTMPPYALITDAFQNWNSVFRTGARRVMRSINIDLQSIRFCSHAEREEWENTQWGKRIDWNEEVPNITAFRRYAEHYVENHPKVRNDRTLIIRELQPTPEGLPVELYFFTSTTEWVAYEGLQSNVMDHFLTKLRDFGLRAFQRPSGYDFCQNPTNNLR